MPNVVARSDSDEAPIKRPLSREKTSLEQEFVFPLLIYFAALSDQHVITIITIAVISIGKVSAFAAPSTHQDQGSGGKLFLLLAPSASWRTRKSSVPCRVQIKCYNSHGC